MSHHHNHTHHHNLKNGGKEILWAFALNLMFSIIEFIGAFYTNSVSIYSDALHDLGDSTALLVAYFAEKLSHKDADKKYTFGYRRFSILSAFITGSILLIGSIFVIQFAIRRIINPAPIRPHGMLWIAILGIVINSIAAYNISKTNGVNNKMVLLHLFEDILGSFSVLIVAIVLLYKPWFILDSILSILISFIVLKSVYKNLMKVFFIFLQKFPDDLELSLIKSKIENFSLVNNIHQIKGWSIDDSSYYLRFHISIPPMTTIEQIDVLKLKIKNLLKNHDVAYSTIEFESMSCDT